MAIVPFQSFAGSSPGVIVERLVQCPQSPMHLVESAALSGSSRLHTSMIFGSIINKQPQSLSAITLPLKLRHSDVIVVYSWR